jgi:hypothetical protein
MMQGFAVALDVAELVISILPFCSTQLGLQGLACLAATNKLLRSACVSTLHLDARCLLLDALDAAVAASPAAASNTGSAVAAGGATDRAMQAVAWLCSAVSDVITSADTAERLISTPAVSLASAVQLVAAGMRVSCKQLLTAANSMVAGVEVWVQAQQQLGIQTDIPAVAVAACCGSNWVSCTTR